MDPHLLRLARERGPVPPGSYRVLVIEADDRVSHRDFARFADAVRYADDAVSESADRPPVAAVLDGRPTVLRRGRSYAAPPVDDSTAADTRGWVRIGIPGGELRGRVIGVSPGMRGEPDRVELAGVDGSAAGSLFVALPDGVRLPVSPGDELVARVRAQVRGIHPVVDACVEGPDGVCVALVSSGDLSFAPGFEAVIGEVASETPPRHPGSAARYSRSVVVRHAGRTALLADNRWRRLDRWLLAGHATDWGPGTLPPDAGPDLSFVIVRIADGEP